ncbi:MAG TPA: bacteriocin ABC transporter, partial [Clostridium sp.]|nr:bacteriocin ABC transporter [Clostridium sp.]
MAVYNLHEITDSKLMYDRKPPKFMMYIIIIVTALIGAFLVWATKSVKTYVVKGQGVVTTENKAHVMAKVSGEIKEVFVEEGKEVKEGDVLVTLNAVEANLQIEQVVSQIELLDKRIELVTRAENDAAKNANTFNKNDAEELEFYNRLSSSYLKRKDYEIDEESLKKQEYTDEQIRDYKKQSRNKLNQMHYETILEFTNEKNQLQLEKEKLETQRVALE